MKFVNPSFSAGTQINNQQISPQPSGTISGQKAVNNYTSKSQSFQQMNAVIVRLDEQYEGLTPTQQADWQAASANYNGIAVCGCKGEVINGKKLYRLTNYALLIAALGQLSEPPPTPTFEENKLTGIDYYVDFPGVGPFMYFSYGGEPGQVIAIAQCGQGLDNPFVVQQPPNSDQFFFPGDPIFQMWEPYLSTGSLPTCQWDYGGGPLGTLEITVNVIGP